jgi:hypothetical protein
MTGKHFLLILFLSTLCLGCINKKTAVSENPDELEISASDENIDIVQMTVVNENYDWFTEYVWFLEDGRWLVDPSFSSADRIDWIGPKTPLVVFQKFIIPSNSILYQVRLRNELFYFTYQTEEKDKLFTIGSAHGTGVFDLEFGENFSYISMKKNGVPYGRQNRVGQQTDLEHPLVGIWGILPNLQEYRLIYPSDCIYFMEIDREIPGWAVREGTYLLKQTGDRIFESISSFPDGRIRIEIKNSQLLLLTPLFSLPDEDGIVAPLLIYGAPPIHENDLY